ncbi:hypothetical protein GCM10022221_64350 [Actinocorallia aurea]
MVSARVETVVLDAANLAAHNPRGKKADWRFTYVDQVKTACERRWDGVLVRAWMDASAEGRLADRDRLRSARQAGWLEIAPGDADDLILEFAGDHRAAVVSRDKFKDARRTHPWLEDPDRVWNWTWEKGEVTLAPRRLRPVTDEEVAAARRKKALKAGVMGLSDGQIWICRAPAGRCKQAGLPTTPKRTLNKYYCARCSYAAEEQVYATVPPAPPTLTLVVDGVHRARLDLAADGVVLGRGGPTRPDVADVTAFLDGGAKNDIGRRHLRIDLDDEGRPVVVHQSEAGSSFLNPRFGPDGLPADHRLEPGTRYPLDDDDELVLGAGRVRLLISFEEGN